MTVNKPSSDNACSCQFVCTYDNVEKEIAWYNEVDGRLKFVGHGSVAPVGYGDSREEEAPAEAISI